MRRGGILGWLGLSVLLATGCRAQPTAHARVGMNLSGIADWGTELPFVDVFKTARAWISQRRGEGWGKGPALELDEHGWVKRLEPGCYAETPMYTEFRGHFPTGDYTVTWEGEGKVELNGARVTRSEPNRLTFTLDPAQGQFFLRVVETNPANYLRNLHVLMPGCAESYLKEPFHPVFLKRWRGMACLRFMDWMATNNSRLAHWSERPKLDDATWTTHGVPLEVMVDLANRLGADPWFCMPHLADDDYVRQFAEQVKQRLDPARKVYLEYSNEVWNGQFAQSRYAGEQGRQRGFGDKPWEAGWRFTAWRSRQIFDLWEQVFGGHERLVRVLPSQAANAYVSGQILGFQDAGHHADVLAIAPYLGLMPRGQGQGLTADQVAGWSVDQVFGYLETKALPEVTGWLAAQKKVADPYGLRLVAYEGGQHCVGIQGGENNQRVTDLFIEANRNPRMATLYRAYFDAWEQAGGDLFCYFTSVSRPSKWGSWGALEHYDDPPTTPKFAAVMDWAKRCGQPVGP